MRKDENGQACPGTLGEYYDYVEMFFGEDDGEFALKFLSDKIKVFGPDEKVIADDSQMRLLLFGLVRDKQEKDNNDVN